MMLWTNIIGFKIAKFYVKISKTANLGYVFGHILSVAMATRHINLQCVYVLYPDRQGMGNIAISQVSVGLCSQINT